MTSAVSKGKRAVAEKLATAGSVRWNTPDDAMELATIVIDAWLAASNPVGAPETIYDEFYRLRAVARLVLRTWDDGSGTADQAEAMEGLRAALMAVSP